MMDVIAVQMPTTRFGKSCTVVFRLRSRCGFGAVLFQDVRDSAATVGVPQVGQRPEDPPITQSRFSVARRTTRLSI
jgi:hypothetical protein